MVETSATSVLPNKRLFDHRHPGCRSFDPWDSVADQIGPLRAYARALAVKRDAADMFVEAAMVTSCKEIDLLEPETDIRIWLFGTLHDTFHAAPLPVRSTIANDKIAVAKARADGSIAPSQFSAAYHSLPVAHREALFLTGAARLSFGEAAAVCKSTVITLIRCTIAGRTRLAMTLFEAPGSNDWPDDDENHI